jgi:hypothetical protein
MWTWRESATPWVTLLFGAVEGEAERGQPPIQLLPIAQDHEVPLARIRHIRSPQYWKRHRRDRVGQLAKRRKRIIVGESGRSENLRRTDAPLFDTLASLASLVDGDTLGRLVNLQSCPVRRARSAPMNILAMARQKAAS